MAAKRSTPTALTTGATMAMNLVTAVNLITTMKSPLLNPLTSDPALLLRGPSPYLGRILKNSKK